MVTGLPQNTFPGVIIYNIETRELEKLDTFKYRLEVKADSYTRAVNFLERNMIRCYSHH